MPTTIQLSQGATDTDIANALQSMTNGGTLVLPKDATIDITKELLINVSNRDITIDLNGSTLVQAANVKMITAYAPHSAMEGVTLGQDADGNATITYNTLPTSLTAGDWVKVISDSPIPGDHIDPSDNGQPTRLGQAAQVLSIDGNTVTLQGPLVDQELYQANVRATEFGTGKFVIENGSIEGDPALWTDLVQLRSIVGAEVNQVRFEGGQGTGVNVVDCANATITDCIAIDIAAGVHSASSLNTSVNGLFAENVAHGVFDNCVGVPPNHYNPSQYGADIGLNAENSVVYAANRAAYDFHSEAVNGRYENDLAFDSRMFGDFRGFNNAMINSGGVGNDFGVQYNEYGVDDARGNLIDNMILRETQNYTFIISNQPADNLVRDSTFESYGVGYRVPSQMVTFENSTIREKVTNNDDTLNGTASDDFLLGGLGTDLLYASEGNDYVWGGELADTLIGGNGMDRFAYHNLAEGGDTILDFTTGSGGDVIDVSVIAARLGWERVDPLATGKLRAEQSGENTIIQAYDGTDWATLATLSGVTATTFGSSNIQMLLSGEALDPVVLSGTEADDTLTGTAADETLDGGQGADVMAGGPGNDVYFVDDPNDQVVEAIGGGTDTVYASTNYTLQAGSEIEILWANAGSTGLVLTGNEFDNLIRGGVGNDSLRGRGGDDTLDGDAGNDSLDGGTGTDILNGGAGDDTYFVDSPTDQIVETAGNGNDTLFVSSSYTLADGVEIELLRANPNAGQVMIRGNSAANVIYGGTGNDSLDGGDGNDSLASGAGNDTIVGGAGNDRIDGGVGADSMVGGAGNDVINVDNVNDTVSEFVGDGIDTVWTTVSYSLQTGSEVENLRSIGTGPFTLTGNEFDNTIQAGSGADVLNGLGGDDILVGGAGVDILMGGAGNDRLEGGAGADAMTGGSGNDTYILDNVTDAVIEEASGGIDTIFTTIDYSLQAGSNVENLRAYNGSAGLSLEGNELNNTIAGGTGDDTIIGASGDDMLVGGAGADTFVFDSGFGIDRITDFTSGEDVCDVDTSVFSDFDALIASAVQSGQDTVIAVDADNQLTLSGVTLSTLQASDFTFT